MGIYLSMALMLCGRATDRLFHVLVAPEFETGVPDFFYPPPQPRLFERLAGHDEAGKPLRVSISSEHARVELAEIPFPRLKEIIGGELPIEKGLIEAISHSQLILNYLQTPPCLTLHLVAGRVSIGDFSFALSRQLAAVYAFFLTEFNAFSATVPISALFHRRDAIARFERRMDHFKAGEREVYAWETMNSIEEFGARIRPCISKVNRAIDAALGRNRLAERYRIRTGRTYGVNIPHFELRD